MTTALSSESAIGNLAAIVDGKGGDTVAIEVRITCGDIVGLRGYYRHQWR